MSKKEKKELIKNILKYNPKRAHEEDYILKIEENFRKKYNKTRHSMSAANFDLSTYLGDEVYT